MCSWAVRLGIRSAVSRCCGSSLILAIAAFGQLNTGTVEGTVRALDGRALSSAAISITGGAGFQRVIHADASGRFAVTLPYGQYKFDGAEVFVAPLQTTRLDLVDWAVDVWTDATRGRVYAEGSSMAGVLLSREPSTVADPLDFTGLHDNRLAVVSQKGFSWTDTQYKLHGMDATDSYQPGVAMVFPDIAALDEVLVRGTEVGLFLAEPRSSWHGALSSANTGAPLSSGNLPAFANRGLVRQTDQFRWYTRDGLEVGGPLAKWADFYASGSGQWASQAEPLARPGTDQNSRLLFGNARGRVRAGANDLFDALYSGSRIDLSNGGIPAGLEALSSNRLAPLFVLPGGFAGDVEVDHLDFIQAGWTHLMRGGVIEVRYGYSVAHLDTSTLQNGRSSIDLLGGQVTGAPPLANLAVRTRQGIEGAWQLPQLARQRLVAGGGWKTSEPRNRFTAPSDMNLITANGAPAFVVEFNTPLDSRELVRARSAYVADHISVAPSLSLDVGAYADFSRGSLPAQSSPGARTFAAQSDLISWNSVSPRAGFAWTMPHSHGLVLRGAYSRWYAPLAGRYLDFGNPNSLSGNVYREQGNLLLRFGGAYSSISAALRRPYSDEFKVGAAFRGIGSIQLFRRDLKDRIAAIDTGVTFTPVSILDPGPDGIPGTFDDQHLTVYAQNPATLGLDRYLLTNPSGLRMLNTGLVAEAGTHWRRLTLHASFVAEKSYGPTNPGDAVYENDPGVIGSLFLDPNTAIRAAGRSFVDRAYVGKIQATYRFLGMDVASVAGYTDGLVFARQLLVTGLPQGPFLVATTVRGSPEGGNRAQYAINWNLRFSRQFRSLRVSADLFDVTNAGQRIQENDLSGPSFNQRLPVAIQPSRYVRLGFRYEF
jgi:hypothetical protein